MAHRSHDPRWSNQRRDAKREPPEPRRRMEEYEEYDESYPEYGDEYQRRYDYGNDEEELYEARNYDRNEPPRGIRENKEKVVPRKGTYNQETLDRPIRNNNNNNNGERREPRQEERRADREDNGRRGSRENILREARREPHLRFEPSPVPFHSHKQAPIDGYGQSPRQKEAETRDPKQRVNRSQENASPSKFPQRNGKKEGPPATAAGSIRTIINNLRGQGGDSQKPTKDDGRNEIPRNKVSTNPFLRNGEKLLSPRNQPEAPKNVSHVVQKMNTGDWPIKIDEEEGPPRPRSVQSFNNEHAMSKAEQWETLDRKSPVNIEDRRTHSKSPVVHRIERSQRNEGLQRRHSEIREMVREEDEEKKRQRSQESDHFSERSELLDQTTVSTDSAMGSDPDNSYDSKIHLPFDLPQGTILRKLPDNVKELNDEAEKLLVYFKGHRSVLNYLGIGLSETLWNHIRALPTLETDILVNTINKTEEKHLQSAKLMKKSDNSAPLPQINIQPPPQASPKKNAKAPPPTFPKAAKSMQSPKLRALEQELCCTDAISDEAYGSNQKEDNVRQETRGGRFVKKSAAALIAKKQGQQALPEDAPLSSDFADPRIAAEIAQLKAREAELQRSRSELGLPTIDDVMDSWSGKAPRSQNNLDYMKQMSQPITKSQSSHSIIIDNTSERNNSDSYYRNESRRSSIQYDEEGYYEKENRILMQRQIENRQYRVSPQNGQFFRDALQSSNGPTSAASKNVRYPSTSSGAQSHPHAAVKRMDITVHTARDSPATPQRYHRQVGL